MADGAVRTPFLGRSIFISSCRAVCRALAVEHKLTTDNEYGVIRAMRGWMLVLVLVAASVCQAEHESNFGRVILSKSDLIVHGVASAQRTRVGGSFRVEVTIERVLYGETELREVSVHYIDRAILPEDDAIRGLFALKELGRGGYELVGKPVFMKTGDAEEAEKVRVARAYIALEAMEAGDDRTRVFWRLLLEHVREGGYPAQNAAVELVFVARDRAGIITEERFAELIEARNDAAGRLTRRTREDLDLAQQGMVESRIKSLKLRRIRRGDDVQDRRLAARELLALIEQYPRAFTRADAELVDAMRNREKDDRVAESLADIARRIRLKVAEREARERG
jgi:hypothetical protein